MATPTIAAAELHLTRALQRYQSSKRACLEMFGTLSILVVPQTEYRALAEASWLVQDARNRLGSLQARYRAQRAVTH